MLKLSPVRHACWTMNFSIEFWIDCWTIPIYIILSILNHTAPSSAPSNVIANTLSSTSIQLSWNALPSGSLNGDLKQYLIKVLLNNETVKTLNTSKTNYNVTGLEKFTIYGFIVSAENQIGEGPGSNEIFSKTLADSKL